MASIKNVRNNKCWWMKNREHACPVSGDADEHSTLVSNTVVPQKLKAKLPYDTVTPRMGIYPKKRKTLIQKEICTPIFTVALVTLARKGKQPACLSAGEGEHVMYIQNEILAIKNKNVSFATTWLDLEGGMLSEISQRR